MLPTCDDWLLHKVGRGKGIHSGYRQRGPKLCLEVHHLPTRTLLWIVIDYGSQFTSNNFHGFCESWRIHLSPSTPEYRHGNGQVEATNKIINDGINKCRDLKKVNWAEELDSVLWSYRTTPKGETNKTPFSLVYGVQSKAHVQVNISSLRRSKMP